MDREMKVIAHIVEFVGEPDQLEKIGMEGFYDRVVPVLRAQAGFGGCITLLNRDTGKMLGVTLWDTADNGRLAGARLEQERVKGADDMGADSPTPEFYEVLAQIS